MLCKGVVFLFLFAFAQGIQTDERLIRDQLTVVKLWFCHHRKHTCIGAAAGGGAVVALPSWVRSTDKSKPASYRLCTGNGVVGARRRRPFRTLFAEPGRIHVDFICWWHLGAYIDGGKPGAGRERGCADGGRAATWG